MDAIHLRSRFDPRDNAMGALRLLLALGVLIGHAWTLGYARPGFGALGPATHAQFNALTIDGFFVISGFLITRSAGRVPWRTFAWHRFLRIFPGLWVCLLLTAGVAAPVAALLERAPWGPLLTGPDTAPGYVLANLFAAMDRYGIGDLLTTTPYGRITGLSVFDGSLWSLKYELLWYVVIGVAAVAGILRRAPRLVVGAAGLAWLAIVAAAVVRSSWAAPAVFPGAIGPLPLLGSFNVNQSVYLGYAFLTGAAAQIAARRIPIRSAVALGAGGVLASSLLLGGYQIVGLPAYAYLLLYASVTAPARLRRVGRRRDYSYGIYLYSFPVEQLLVVAGAARAGLPAYLGLSGVLTVALAAGSWHLVERPALALRQRLGRPVAGRAWPARPRKAGG